jgi:hypothetical protein
MSKRAIAVRGGSSLSTTLRVSLPSLVDAQ